MNDHTVPTAGILKIHKIELKVLFGAETGVASAIARADMEGHPARHMRGFRGMTSDFYIAVKVSRRNDFDFSTTIGKLQIRIVSHRPPFTGEDIADKNYFAACP